jgi:hypothetical protein
MDITPLNTGLSALSGGTIALIVSLLIATAVICFLLIKKTQSDARFPAAISIAVMGVVGAIALGAITIEAEESKRSDQAKAYISSLGFDFKDGGIALKPGTDKDFTVSKNDEDFKCTSYAPDSVNDKVFLVCEDAIHMSKGNIEDLSKQLNGMKIRNDALKAHAEQK